MTHENANAAMSKLLDTLLKLFPSLDFEKLHSVEENSSN